MFKTAWKKILGAWVRQTFLKTQKAGPTFKIF